MSGPESGLEVLTLAQWRQYRDEGYTVVDGVLSSDELEQLRRATEELVDGARGVTQHTALYDLDPSHTPEVPRIRRLKEPHRFHDAHARLVKHPRILGAMRDLWGPDIRFQFSKLNMKSAGYGAAVEWHQDWAFYPHTNDDLAAVGIMLDDCGADNGPLLVIPGSHLGPTFSHHVDGKFIAAIDPRNTEVGFDRAVALKGKAGSMTIHHVRAVHASAPNRSARDRRLLLYQYRAADAWPLKGIPEGFDAWESLMLCGRSTLEPRMIPLPLRMPFPLAERQGSLYENQATMPVRYFD
jgi:phytanoyl-CoA hydroxylase